MRMRLLFLLILTIAFRGSHAQATSQMAKDAHPTFEVVTIKPSDPDSHRQGINYDGHRGHIACQRGVRQREPSIANTRIECAEQVGWNTLLKQLRRLKGAVLIEGHSFLLNVKRPPLGGCVYLVAGAGYTSAHA